MLNKTKKIVKKKYNKTIKNKNFYKNPRKINNKNTLLLVVDAQEKYRKQMINTNKNFIKDLKNIIDIFDKKKYKIAFTRYARCKTEFKCDIDKNKDINALSIIMNTLDKKETKKFKPNTKYWELLKEIKDYEDKKYPIFDTELLNPFIIPEFKTYIKNNNIKNIILIGGWAEHCILSNVNYSIHNNIVPYVIKDCIFGSNKKKIKKAFDIMYDIAFIIPKSSIKYIY